MLHEGSINLCPEGGEVGVGVGVGSILQYICVQGENIFILSWRGGGGGGGGRWHKQPCPGGLYVEKKKKRCPGVHILYEYCPTINRITQILL